ncbi:hypothetical protein [Maribacter halichondriae]|uniref:hypothetical protein n=1 Tax=Maribacter halichondriae TaxID=2980554 RepID=UPI0023583DFD|nr:hypothetical protein [Maribacter sp. Hal144]
MAQLARERNDLRIALKYYNLAFEEEPENDFANYQICAVSEQLHDDPKKKLECYEAFLKRYIDKKSFYKDFVTKRVSELKEEIHFAKE